VKTPVEPARLASVKRRAYGVALGLAGLASLVDFDLARGSESEAVRWLFGPVVALICFAFGCVFSMSVVSIRTLEKAAVAVAWTFIVIRAATGLFVFEDGSIRPSATPHLSSWSGTGFIFVFVAMRTRDALPTALGLYAALVGLGGAHVLLRGGSHMDRTVLGSLVEQLVVTNAFTVTFLYFLARTKEELARERTERVLMARLAHTDDLTQLPNRRFILQALAREVARADRDGSSLSVIMFDLDRFKSINDTYGHATGDAVLRRAASLAREGVRSTDELGRYGGEEFLVVAFDAQLDDTAHLAERLRTAFEKHSAPDEPPFTASFGVATHRQHEPLTSLLSRADDALYASKSRGRNRVTRDTELGAPLPVESAPTAIPGGRASATE